MTFDYFYGSQADQFSFYRIPKVLFTEEQFRAISPEAKILYGLLLDRMSLSQKNGWFDADSRVYIFFTVEEITEAFGCAGQKAVKLLNELESKAGLIERKRQGLGKPNLIYQCSLRIDRFRFQIKLIVPDDPVAAGSKLSGSKQGAVGKGRQRRIHIKHDSHVELLHAAVTKGKFQHSSVTVFNFYGFMKHISRSAGALYIFQSPTYSPIPFDTSE